MLNYSLMLMNGQGTTGNIEEAAKYMKMSADKGNIVAMSKYVSMLKNGNGVKKDNLYLDADGGFLNALFNYASMGKDVFWYTDIFLIPIAILVFCEKIKHSYFTVICYIGIFKSFNIVSCVKMSIWIICSDITVWCSS